MSSMSLMNKASKNSEDMREIASRICRDYLTGAWKTIAASELQLKRISGGLSNFLYYVSLPDDMDNGNRSSLSPTSSVKRPRTDSINLQEPKEVLLRIYGRTHGEQALETVLTDTVVFTLLSERKLGPKLHGIFPGGRIEQYIPARALSTNELSDEKISCKIAEKMAKIHSLNIPVSKEPDWLWVTMQRWLANLEDILTTYKTKNDNDMKILEAISKIDFRKELQWLKTTVETADYPVVFCHNDLQEGNILYRELSSGYTSTGSSVEQLSTFFDDTANLDSHFDTHLLSPNNQRNGNSTYHSICSRPQRKRLLSDHHNSQPIDDLDNTRDSVLSGQSQASSDNGEPDMIIIDFEYCAYNYRGFDLANHFIEWTIDYTNKEFPFYYHKREQYPTVEQQERFITTYLHGLNASQDYTPSESEIEELKEEIMCFTMASHLFWSLWAFVNVYQDIEFGYWPYGQSRMQEYFAAKKAFAKAKGLDLKHTHTLDDRK